MNRPPFGARSRWLIGLIAATAGVLVGARLDYFRPRADVPDHAPRLTVEQLQPLSSMVTHRVRVADVTLARLPGYSGSAEAVLLVKGDVLVQIDLSEAHLDQVNQDRRRAVLILPEPRIFQPRVDHESTRIVAVSQKGLWQWVPGGRGADARVVEMALRDAQRRVGDAAGGSDIITEAKVRAETMLRGFCAAVGWDVAVTWDGGAR